MNYWEPLRLRLSFTRCVGCFTFLEGLNSELFISKTGSQPPWGNILVNIDSRMFQQGNISEIPVIYDSAWSHPPQRTQFITDTYMNNNKN